MYFHLFCSFLAWFWASTEAPGGVHAPARLLVLTLEAPVLVAELHHVGLRALLSGDVRLRT